MVMQRHVLDMIFLLQVVFVVCRVCQWKKTYENRPIFGK